MGQELQANRLDRKSLQISQISLTDVNYGHPKRIFQSILKGVFRIFPIFQKRTHQRNLTRTTKPNHRLVFRGSYEEIVKIKKTQESCIRGGKPTV